MTAKPRIAHLAGPNATIQNSPPLVTSNKARAKYGLPLVANPDRSPARFDVLRPQRLALPVKVYVEQFGAHPLERDAAELYGPPDGYLDAQGQFRKERRSPDDKPVYEIELQPEDGLYPMPYMARQADGRAWDDDSAEPGAPANRARQPFYPDGSRPFEEIDRLGIGHHGTGNLISSQADIDFYRVLPPSGYTKGLEAGKRTDVGSEDIAPETRGRDFFPYRPPHIAASPPRPALARITNAAQKILAGGEYLGAIWTQGSPRIEEQIYWFNLLLDTTLPICGNAAQRAHGQISNDGPKNIVDSVTYLTSRVWADEAGRNRAGMVLIQEQRVFAARDVQKGDARPGGYIATGGHGGILGTVGGESVPMLTYLPATRHTWRSEVNVTRLPREVMGARSEGGRMVPIPVPIKTAGGELLESAIPKVTIVKDGNYLADDYTLDVERQVDVFAQIDANLRSAPLAGFVYEGLSPYGYGVDAARNQAMLRAIHRGMPVVSVGRGNNDGFTPGRDLFIGGSNLTATKARLLLMACLMRFGGLPPAADPQRPTDAELAAIRAKLAEYQAVFFTH
ncbi:MAG: asparaginase [Betaproteobacteria bacterium]|nr:asparaginase [Betaproteobacteria bacterium]